MAEPNTWEGGEKRESMTKTEREADRQIIKGSMVKWYSGS